MDPDPQSNPVNRLVKEMRDAGELVVREFDRGSPLVSLPVSEAAPDPTHEATQEQVVAADGRIPSSEETSPAAAPPLVRPDRQFTFDGLTALRMAEAGGRSEYDHG